MDNSFEDELSCPICYINYEQNSKPLIICGNSHIICDPCLWKMYIDLNAKLVCPLCKLEIDKKGVSQTHLEKAMRLKMEEQAKKQEIEKEKEREKQREKQRELQRLQREKEKEQESSLIPKNRAVEPAVRHDLQMGPTKADKEKQLRQITLLNKQFQERTRITQTRPPSTFISSSQTPTQAQVRFSFASPSNANINQPLTNLQKPFQNKSNPYLP